MVREGKIVYFSRGYIKIRDPVANWDVCGKVVSLPEALHNVPGQKIIDKKIKYDIVSSDLTSNDPCSRNTIKIHSVD